MATRNSVLKKLDLSTYTPRTDDEIKQLAESLYQAKLTSDLTNAQNTYDTNYNALENERVGVNTNYDRQYDKQASQNAQSIAAADRATIARGMQRSSYNAQNLSSLRASGDRSLAEIEQDRTNALGKIDSQQTVLASNLANSQNSANSEYASNVLAKTLELQDQEYQRQEANRQNNNSTILQWAGLLKDKRSGGGSGGKNNGDKGKAYSDSLNAYYESQVRNWQAQQQAQQKARNATATQSAASYATPKKTTTYTDPTKKTSGTGSIKTKNSKVNTRMSVRD